ncbi:MAG: hypothetical protein MUF45_14770 [Spirosomaceae bacterium]|nr:hypothetical protein [Spirosomataceae bacterium]
MMLLLNFNNQRIKSIAFLHKIAPPEQTVNSLTHFIRLPHCYLSISIINASNPWHSYIKSLHQSRRSIA